MTFNVRAFFSFPVIWDYEGNLGTVTQGFMKHRNRKCGTLKLTSQQHDIGLFQWDDANFTLASYLANV